MFIFNEMIKGVDFLIKNRILSACFIVVMTILSIEGGLRSWEQMSNANKQPIVMSSCKSSTN